MRIKRNLFFLVIFGLLSWLAIYSYNHVTDGFSIYQMSSSLPPCPQFEVALTHEKKESLQQVLDQPFRYMGKGCQFYVFSSADNHYVIKFLKQKHLRQFEWLQRLPMPHPWRKLADQKIERRKERVERLFSSCKLAYEKMAEETGLLYVHLNQIPALEKEILLIDKLGLNHHVAIDDYEFVIQKKAVPVKEALADLTPEEVAHKIEELAHLVLARCQKGIRDRDRSFVQNVAFSASEGRAIFTDVGQFYEDPTILLEEEQAKDLAKRLSNLGYWMGRHFPDLAQTVP